MNNWIPLSPRYVRDLDSVKELDRSKARLTLSPYDFPLSVSARLDKSKEIVQIDLEYSAGGKTERKKLLDTPEVIGKLALESHRLYGLEIDQKAMCLTPDQLKETLKKAFVGLRRLSAGDNLVDVARLEIAEAAISQNSDRLFAQR